MSASGRAGGHAGFAGVAGGTSKSKVHAVSEKRLAQYGLHSERVMWQGKGPSVFEQELGDLEQQLGLTTVEKAVAWAQGSSVWPDTVGLACCRSGTRALVSARRSVVGLGSGLS